MSDPYGPDDDEPDERPNVGDPYTVGVRRVPRPPQAPGVPLQHVNSRASGVAYTPLPYDPRTAAGVALTRISYDPHSFAGSTGQSLLPDEVAKSHLERAGAVPEWFIPWVTERAKKGEYPPSWAPGICAARGRPDLAEWCNQVTAALFEQHERRKGA